MVEISCRVSQAIFCIFSPAKVPLVIMSFGLAGFVQLAGSFLSSSRFPLLPMISNEEFSFLLFYVIRRVVVLFSWYLVMMGVAVSLFSLPKGIQHAKAS